MNSKTYPLLASLLAGVLIGYLLLPGGRIGSMMYGSYSPSGSQSGTGMSAGVDRHFIEQMIPHHEGAIAMARIALERSSRPEIRQLAENIIDSQSREIEQMRAWYLGWYGSEVPQDDLSLGGMMMGDGMHGGTDQDTSALSAATDVDREFLAQMIPHHQMAVMMARMLDAGTSRPEMKEFAASISNDQSSEIRQMQSWYDAWYQ